MNLVEQTIAKLSGPGPDGPEQADLTRPRRISYYVLILTIILAGVFRLGTPVVTILFSFFALTHLRFLKRKALDATLSTFSL